MKIKSSSTIITRIEHISFQSNNEYMDIERHEGYIDISIGGTENAKFSVTPEDWEEINQKVLELFKQMK
jgi:hypothetical protein